MLHIQGLIRTDRQPNAVKRQGVETTYRGQVAVRRPARAHIVFCVNLEESDVRPRFKDRAVVLRLEADAGTPGQIMSD